jgi:hypothetical protein
LLDSDRWYATVVGVQDWPGPDEHDDEPGSEEHAEFEGGGGDLPFAGALGVDPEQPDPGCGHGWRNLQFLDEDEGIVCSRCTRAWSLEDDARDAVLTLWDSTRRALDELTLQQARLIRIIEELTGSAHCHWCGRWEEGPEGFVAISTRRVCPEHLGQLLAEVAPIDSEDIGAVRRWLGQNLATNEGDVYALWLVEKSVVECPELLHGDFSVENIGNRTVELPPTWAEHLAVSTSSTVNTVSTAIASLLELPAPTSRAGRSFLLGTLARALWAARHEKALDADALTELLMEAAPSGTRDRATVVLDLYREEMQVDGTVTGVMADDLVEALIGRAGSELAPLLPRAM